MKKYEGLAKDILDHIGGTGNVIDVVHCITRLRFHLKDEGKAGIEAAGEQEERRGNIFNRFIGFLAS